MPIGTYTMLKGTKPAFEEKSSANYYAYGPSGAVTTYKTVSYTHLFQGFGNMISLTIMSIIREFLGAGTFGGGILNGGAGYQILPEDVVALGMILPVGGFLTLGVVIATVQYFMSKPKKNKEVAK